MWHVTSQCVLKLCQQRRVFTQSLCLNERKGVRKSEKAREGERDACAFATCLCLYVCVSVRLYGNATSHT